MRSRQILAGIPANEGEKITDLSALDVDDAQVLAVPHPHSPPRTGGNHHVGRPVSKLHDSIQLAVTTDTDEDLPGVGTIPGLMHAAWGPHGDKFGPLAVRRGV